MKWKYLLLLAAFALIGCQGLKEKQLGAYIGDTQTKTYYRNTTELHSKIPKNRQIFFANMDEAMKAGYQSSQEGEGEGAGGDQ